MTANDVFTDRVDEQAAFLTALQVVRERRVESRAAVDDPALARRNVLVYYGVGGIGKTTLSRRLEATFRTLDGPSSGRVSIRIDFEEVGTSDMEALILRLRAGLGALGPQWKAFDLAFASYWSQAHAGEPLSEFLDRSPVVRNVASKFSVGDQMVDTLSDATKVQLGGVSGLAQWGLLEASRIIRQGARQRKLLADCAMFEAMVGADADHDTLSYFPYLLAWDLAQLSRPSRGQEPDVVVFLDTYEQTAEFGVPFRRALQRMMFLMPNVLFVVTGRNRIDWAERADSSELDYTGDARWPLLHFSNAAEEPRQHLVGYLSDSDADSYLSAALIEEGRPALSAEIRQKIIEGGQGLPLYLDLSASHYVSLVGVGRKPVLEDFGGPLTAVASRALRDLGDEERALARAAALVDRYDEHLLRIAVPTASLGRVHRFLERPFQTRVSDGTMGYTLHTCMREAILEADKDLPDGWTDEDRSRVAGLMFDALARKARQASGPAEIAETLEVGVRLAVRRNWFDSWLVESTLSLIQQGAWGRLPVILSLESDHAPIRGLQALAQGVLLRRNGEPRQSANVLARAFRDASDVPLLQAALRVNLAHTERNLGEYLTANDRYRRELDGPLGREARLWSGDFAFLTGAFREALASAESCAGDDGLGREAARLKAHVKRINARFADAADLYRNLAAQAREAQDFAAVVKALVGLAQTTCWTDDPDETLQHVGEARSLLELVPNSVEGVKATQAFALACIRSGRTGNTTELIDAIRGEAEKAQYKGGHNLYDVAIALYRIRAGDSDGGLRAIRSLQHRTTSSGGNSYWVAITRSWLGSEPTGSISSDQQWLDGEERVLSRWREVGLG